MKAADIGLVKRQATLDIRDATNIIRRMIANEKQGVQKSGGKRITQVHSEFYLPSYLLHRFLPC